MGNLSQKLTKFSLLTLKLIFMKYWKVIETAYKIIVRPLIEKSIKESESKWDDSLLAILDEIFDYES